jgi:hypothetical protein
VRDADDEESSTSSGHAADSEEEKGEDVLVEKEGVSFVNG